MDDFGEGIDQETGFLSTSFDGQQKAYIETRFLIQISPRNLRNRNIGFWFNNINLSVAPCDRWRGDRTGRHRSHENISVLIQIKNIEGHGNAMSLDEILIHADFR